MNTPFRLQRLDWQRLELPLARPLQTSAGRFAKREILVIRATVHVGAATVHGFGEASPLVGWNEGGRTKKAGRKAATVDDCVGLLERAPTDVAFSSIRMLDDVLGAIAQNPSLRFGVELALLDALARHREVPICRLLAAERGRMPLGSVPVQFTIGAGTTEETLAAAQRAKDEGYECLKIKIGAAPLTADIARVGQVCKAFPTLKKRLDVNGAWHPDDALHIIRALGPSRIDLIEQPVPRAHFAALLEQLEPASALPSIDIAPDESCVPIEDAHAFVRAQQVRAMVLKPQALGGILPTCDLMDDAQRRGIRVILSTLLESAIGRSAIAHLAAAYPDVDGPHGLATGPWFAEDVRDEQDRLESGRFVLPNGPGLGFEPFWRSA